MLTKTWTIVVIACLAVAVLAISLAGVAAVTSGKLPSLMTPRGASVTDQVGRDSTWSSIRGGWANTACSPGHGARGRRKWEYRTGGAAVTPVIGSDATLYVLVRGRTERVCALYSKTGKERWTADITPVAGGGHRFGEAEVSYAPSLAISVTGVVYAPSSDNKLWAIQSTNGSVLWKLDTDSEITGSPNTDQSGVAYFGTRDGRLYAVDGSRKAQKWASKLSSSIATSPAIDDGGAVYVGTADGLVAVRSDSGSELWRSLPNDQVYTPVIGMSGKLYVSTGVAGDNVFGGVARNAKPVWSFYAGHVISDPAIGLDGTVYVQNSDGQIGTLYALDGATGKVKWQFGHVTGEASPVVAGNGDVYVIASPKLLALDSRTGKVEWRLDLGLGPWVSSPAIGPDGTIYIGTSDGRIIAVQ